ncbi:hypothetical protein NX89_05720 [Neisseria meningitidis]|nr:hypothetical protein NX89_05720 [Neisseria meningitidis]
MNKLFITALSALALSACAGTWEARNKTPPATLTKHRPPPNAPPNKQATPSKKGWDKTKEAVKKRRQCRRTRHFPSRGKIENATE